MYIFVSMVIILTRDWNTAKKKMLHYEGGVLQLLGWGVARGVSSGKRGVAFDITLYW